MAGVGIPFRHRPGGYAQTLGELLVGHPQRQPQRADFPACPLHDDRVPRALLVWHGDIWLIDHGAALYFHHNWPAADPKRAFDAREHVLGDRAAAGLGAAHAVLAPLITEDLLREVTGLVPPGWLGDRGADAYAEYLLLRVPVVPEVIRR
jgi:hypothetical protein